MNKKNLQHTFKVSFETDMGEQLDGTFTVKRLSISERSRVGVRRSQLSGGMYCVYDDRGRPTGQGIDEDTNFINTAIAHLEVGLIQKPEWFDLEEIHDDRLMSHVYSEVMKFEATFLGRTKPDNTDQEHGGRSSDGVGAVDADEQSGNSPQKVVGGQVSASLDP